MNQTITCEDFAKHIGRNIVIITPHDCDINFKPSKEPNHISLYLNKNINITSNKLKPDNTIDIVIKNLAIIITYPQYVMFKIDKPPKLYFVNLSYEFSRYTIKTCENIEDIDYVISSYMHLQQLSLKIVIDKSIYKETIIRSGNTIAELYFLNCYNVNNAIPEIFFVKDNSLYKQLYIKEQR